MSTKIKYCQLIYIYVCSAVVFAFVISSRFSIRGAYRIYRFCTTGIQYPTPLPLWGTNVLRNMNRGMY